MTDEVVTLHLYRNACLGCCLDAAVKAASDKVGRDLRPYVESLGEPEELSGDGGMHWQMPVSYLDGITPAEMDVLRGVLREHRIG